MSQLIFGLFILLFFLLLWAVTGHGMWVVLSSVFRLASKIRCPECKEQLTQDDKACRKCGWTSRPVDRTTAMRVCHQALNAAYERGLMDKEAFDRGVATANELELALAGKTKIANASPVAPTLPTVHTERIVEATLVPILSPLATIAPLAPADLPPVLVSAVSLPHLHALDREYEEAPSVASPKLSRVKQTWGKWLSAFMEEKNIQWGELAGGLLILCCSTALVLSFWEHIASRPWLKFSIFTGVNAATLGLGLNAYYRWKLPTTSRGILMIGMLLLPLNFLAFAIFTLGAAWDWSTVVGECLSLGLLGCLVYFAAKVVTPRCEVITTATIVGFAIANLLVRRFVDAQSNTTTLFLAAGALVGFYVSAMLLGKRLLSKSDPGETHSLLRLLGLGSFGFLIAFGLLLGCSGNPIRSLHYLSPLLWIGSLPFLMVSMTIGLKATPKSQLLLVSVVLAAFAIGFACFGVVFAWPMPLLIVASLVGLGLLIAFVAHELPLPKIGYAWYLPGGCVAVVGWHVVRGHVALLNDDWRLMLQGLASADTGFVLVVWSGVCGALSVLLSRVERPADGLVALRSAGLIGVVGTILLTAFGFGRHEYATSVATIYLLYAAALIVVSTIRGNRYLDALAGAFVVAACFQGIAFGWLQEAGILALMYWPLTAAAILLVVAERVRNTSFAHSPLAIWYRGVAVLDIVVAVLWLFISESGAVRPELRMIGVTELVLLAAVWMAIAWLETKAVDWTVAQWIGLAAGMLWIQHFAKNQDWYEVIPIGFLHPMSIQMHVAWLAIFASLSFLVVSLAERLKTSSLVVSQFVTLHQFSIAPGLTWVAVVGYLGLAYYGAASGSIQELIPRDGLASTQAVQFEVAGTVVTRIIPEIGQLEIPGIPHGAAGWNREGIEASIAGVPRMGWLWGLLCLSLIIGIWSKPSLDRTCGLISCLLTIAVTIASHWESDVAVASALRWASSFAFGLGCVVLCGWYMVRSSEASGPPDKRASRFDATFATLVANGLVPLALLGVIVVAGTIPHFTMDSWRAAAWFATGLLAFCSGAIFLTASSQPGKSLGSQYRIAALVLLVSPLLAWFVLNVVLALVEHPLTGPNGNSIFVRMGLATSYTVPILIFSVGLIANSVVRRSPGSAFAACLVLLVSGLSGFLLTFKSEGLKPDAWIGLLATLTTISGGFALVWIWYSQTTSILLFGRIPARPHLESDRKYWQCNLRQIAIGFLAASVCLTALLVLASGAMLNRIELFSLGAIASAGVACAANWVATKEAMWHWWLVAVSVLGAGCVAGLAVSSTLAIELPCIVLLGCAVIMTWLIAKPTSARSERMAMSLPLLLGFFLALRLLMIGKTETISASLLFAVASISLFIAWRTGRFGFGVGAIVAAQMAALVHTSSNWGGPSISDHVSNTLLLQISMAVMMSFLCSMAGFAARMRIMHGTAVFLLAMMSAFWYIASLNAKIDPFAYTYYTAAILISLWGSIARYWLRSSRSTDLLGYVSGLCGVVLFFQLVHAEPKELQWISTLGFAAFCLASSFVWRGSDRIRVAINRLGILPTLEARTSSPVVIIANTLLAFGVVGMGLAAQFLCESQPLRLASSQAIMAVAFAVGLLARYKDLSATVADGSQPDEGSRAMRFIALTFGVCAAVACGWHFESIENISLINRLSYACLTIAIMGIVYGFGLIKWIGLSDRWCDAALSLMPYLVGAAAIGVCSALMVEWSLGYELLQERISFAAIACIVISLIASIAAGLAAALIPGRDPFGLSERGRTVYVYASEVLLVLLMIHMRLTMPWLFGGWIQAVWPLLIVGLAFVGLGFSEWAKRNKLSVLAEPLERSGMVLPILPLLTHWIVPSQVDYGVSLLCASVAYASFGYLRKSMLYWGASVVTGNGALWYGLHSSQFRFTDHPQLWVIPPALSLLVILQVLRDRLPREQLAAGRYLATGSIYVASTAEIFIQGISTAPWLPIVLAGLSICGIFVGIAFRIRAMLWLGLMFLCVAMFSVIWHAAVDLAQTWVWYVSGIVMGVLILTIFALFEKRREQLKGLVSKLQTWDD